MAVIDTDVTRLLKIRHPILLAGMFGVSHHDLAAAVSNAGGLGTIGGLTMKPDMLRKEIALLKSRLDDKTAFGVDLAWPKIGGGARKTNKDYTEGNFPELIDIIIKEKARLFVCAIGIPPVWAVEKLHAAGIVVMNMVGDPEHVDKALSTGVDLICAQGTEAGGHTGLIGTMPLIPQCVDRCRGKKSPLTGDPIHVLAAGGIYDGRGLAASLSLGAQAVWVGTRFVASKESAGSKMHKKSLIDAKASDTVRTLIFTGRPVRAYRTEYVNHWEVNRQQEIKELCDKGIAPVNKDMQGKGIPTVNGKKMSFADIYPRMFGQACGGIDEVLPAGVIIERMVKEGAEVLQRGSRYVSRL